MNKHEIYVVGGAVRNVLMGVPVKDMDYVVVGATAEEMLSLGYNRVGSDFPVFLHPETGDEYALARTERKNGKGYHGFVTIADPTITLEEDLGRRDLTVNAMAVHVDKWDLFANGDQSTAYWHPENFVVDPYDGLNDLENRVARPCALKSFIEDPLRLLRAARFSAVYGLTWASEMFDAAHAIIESGELSTISKERYFAEIEKVIDQCPTAGPIAKFSMQLHQFDLFGPYFDYAKNGDVISLMRYKAHRNPAKSLAAKLMAFCPQNLKSQYAERFSLSNAFVDQLDFAHQTVHAAGLIAAHRENMPLCYEPGAFVWTWYEDLKKAKSCIDVKFVTDLASDEPSVQVLVDLLPKLDEVMETVNFDSVCKGRTDLEPKKYGLAIRQARIAAISEML